MEIRAIVKNFNSAVDKVLTVIIPSVTAIKSGTLKYLPITGLILIMVLFLPSWTVSDLIKSNKTPGIETDSYPFERAVKARENLKSIADAQVLYFAEHNHWAGYENEKKVFDLLGWKPAGERHYAYYCGNDSIMPQAGGSFKKFPDPEVDWPFAFYPGIKVSDFICMAIANNDRDSFPDVWMINKFSRPIHLLDDANDRVVVDIFSELFDEKIYYQNHFTGEAGKQLSRVFIRINLPAYRLDLYEAGRRLKSYPIAIGMRGYKTPERTFYLEKMEWNPWFYPPNANWCKKEGEDTCKPVSPGPWNPLWPVKMILQSSYLIHGTPKTSSIGRKGSHGCIRMYPKDAADLAWKVMVLAGTLEPLLKKELFKTKSRKTIRMVLLEPVQVNTVYERLEIYDGQLLFHADPYKWQPMDAEKIKAMLSEIGITIDNFGEDHKRKLLHSKPKETVSVPITL